MTISFENLSESEIMLPGAFVAWLHFKRPPGEVDSIIEILQREKHPCKVKEDFGIVRRNGKCSAKTFDSLLCIAFYAPKVSYLIVELYRLRFLKWRSKYVLSNYFINNLYKGLVIKNFIKNVENLVRHLLK